MPVHRHAHFRSWHAVGGKGGSWIISTWGILASAGCLIGLAGCGQDDAPETALSGADRYEVIEPGRKARGPDRPTEAPATGRKPAGRSASESEGDPTRVRPPRTPADPPRDPDSGRPGPESERPGPEPGKQPAPAGADPTAPEVMDGVPKPPSVPAKTLGDTPTPAPDRASVDASAEALRAHVRAIRAADATLRKLAQRQARPEERQTLLARVRRTLHEKEQAADRLFAGATGPRQANLRYEAVQAKLDCLLQLSQLGDQTVLKRLDAFADELTKTGDVRLVRRGRFIQASRSLDRLRQEGPAAQPDVLMKRFKEGFGEKDVDPALIMLVQEAVPLLTALGKKKESIELLDAAARAAGTRKEARMLALATQFAHQAEVLRMDFEEKLAAVLRDGAASSDEANLRDAVDRLSKLAPPGEVVLFNLTHAMSVLERGGRFDLCRVVCGVIRKHYENHDDPKLKQIAMSKVKDTETRLDLIGKPLEVTGVVTADGKPFAWARYEGKVVLFDFWASPAAGWRRWAAELEKVYNDYADRGFEIVAMNVDGDRRAAEQAWKRAGLPWPTTFSANVDRHVLASRFRVQSLPFTVLVDRNGVVVDLFVTPRRLRKRLAKMLPADGTRPDSARRERSP